MTKEINKNGRKDDFIILYVLNVDKWRAPKDCRQAAVLNGLSIFQILCLSCHLQIQIML